MPAALIVLAITWLLYSACARARAPTTSWSSSSSLVLALFVGARARCTSIPANYTPFAPNGWHRHPPGRGDRLLRVHRLRRDLDRGRGDARIRSATCRSASSAGSRICTVIYVIVGIVRDRAGAVHSSCGAPIRWRARSSVAGLPIASWIVAFGAVVSLTAVLLVFQYGQPRIFFAMARDGLLPKWASQRASEVPDAAHHDARHRARRRGRRVSIADENEIYDLTNIGTLFAFAIVCVGVLVLRVNAIRTVRGRSACPFVWVVAPARRRRVRLHR